MNVFLSNNIMYKKFTIYVSSIILTVIIGLILLTKFISIEYFLLVLIISFLCSIVIYKPLWGLYIFAFLMPLEEVFYFEGGEFAGTILKPLGIIIFIGWLIQQFLRKKDIYFPKVIKYAFLFATWAMLSLSWSYQPYISGVFTLFTLVGLLFIVPQIVTNLKDLNKIIIFSVSGSLISIAFAINFFFQNPNIRAFILGKNPVHYAISISWAIFYFFVYAIYGSKVRKMFSIPFFLLSLLAVFSSQTRSYILAFSFSILFYLWYLVKFEKYNIVNKLFTFIIILALIIILSSIYISDVFLDRINKVLIYKMQSTPRFEAWYVSYLIFLKFPFTGVGFNNLYLLYSKFYQSNFIILHGGICAHNIYFESLADLGIFGFILIILIVFLVFYSLLKTFLRFCKSISISNRCMGLIIVLYMVALIVTSFWQPMLIRKYFWFGLAVSLTFTKLIRKTRSL